MSDKYYMPDGNIFILMVYMYYSFLTHKVRKNKRAD